MTLTKERLFLRIVVGLAVLYCLSLIPTARFTIPEDFPCSVNPAARNHSTSAVSNVPLRLLHSHVTQDLVDGRLLLDPADNKSWSIFERDSLDHACSQYKTRFGLHLPRVWLASFPRSGNTWTRYMLEAASGVFTGSIYVDKDMFTAGYLGEKENHRSQRTLLQKTHLHGVHSINISLYTRFQMGARSIPTVLLLRNPAKAVLSYYKYNKNRHHPSRIPAHAYESEAFHRFVKDKVKHWMELALDRLLWTEAPLYVLHYERLLENPMKELNALLAFLGVPRDEGRLACLSLQLEGKFKSEKSEPRDPYTVQEKIMMAAGALAVNRTLMLLGYPPLPTY